MAINHIFRIGSPGVAPVVTSASYTAGSAGSPAEVAVFGTYDGIDTKTLYGVTGNDPITVSKAQIKAGSGGTNTLGFFSISSFDFNDGSFDVTGLDAADEGDYIAFYIEEDNNGGSSDIEQVAATPQDFTAPTFSSANVNTAGDTLQVVFDSAVYGTSIPAAFTLSGVSAGTPTLGTITGFGTTTLSIPLSVNLPANGDTLTLAYAAGTGDLVDVAGNALASFTGQSVTNNVPAAGGITFVGGRTDEVLDDVTGTVNNIALPSGLAENDIVIVTVASDGLVVNGSAAGGSVTVDATGNGWDIIFNPGGNKPGTIAVMKRMGATPDTIIPIYGENSGSNHGVIAIQAFRGVDTTTALDTAVTTASGASGPPSSPAITTVTDGAWVVAIGAVDDPGGGLTTAPTGYTNANFILGTQGFVMGASIGMASKEIATAGAETPGAFGGDDDEWNAASVALRPA